MKECPKCNFMNTDNSEECQKCGIIFKKFVTSQKTEVPKKQAVLIKCGVCGKEISKNATTCPNCGEPNKTENTEPPPGVSVQKNLTARKSISLILGLFLLILFFISITASDDNKTVTINRSAVKPAVKVASMPAIAIDSKALFSEYKSNEVRADEKYKGRILIVSGYIDSIGKDILDDMYITLKTEEVIFSTQCFFDKRHASALAKLNKGDFVKVRGLCKGKLGNVLVKDCILQ